MKSDGLLRQLLIAFVIAVIIYIALFTGIEHQRTRRGPWQVTFTNDAAGTPALVIGQPVLAISNLWITFPGGKWAGTNSPGALTFAEPQPVPFPTPLGQCVFEDTTFLPGTVVFEIFGHEIQLLPRVLTIDQEERPWQSNTRMALAPTNRPARRR